MELEFGLIGSLLLALAGLAAGFINTFAGGGAMITVPLMILMGIPADVANGSNRLAVITQSLTGVSGFNKHDVFKDVDLFAILAPTVLGTVMGALLISYVPVQYVKYILLGTMITISLLIMFFPDSVFADEGERAFLMKEKPTAFFWMFLAGFYGGAIQAGVGFVLITILGAVLRHNLVTVNAIKLAATSVFGIFSFGIFYFRDQVWWQPAIILAISSMVGVALSVRFVLNVDQRILKRILMSMVVLACISALVN